MSENHSNFKSFGSIAISFAIVIGVAFYFTLYNPPEFLGAKQRINCMKIEDLGPRFDELEEKGRKEHLTEEEYEEWKAFVECKPITE